MAKGNIFVGTASGKVGNLVLSRNALAENYTDKQIIRAYTDKTGRKKGVTYSDNVYHQNAHFKASSQFFELVKSVSGHGFQTAKKTVAANRLAFKSANDVKAAPAYYAVCGAGDDSRYVLAPWILTKGSMLQPHCHYENQKGYMLGIYCDPTVLNLESDNATVVNRVAGALLQESRNTPYLSENCQISVMVFRSETNDPYMNLWMEKYEFTILPNFGEEITGAPFNLFSKEGMKNISLKADAETHELYIEGTLLGANIRGVAICISKFEDGNKKKLKVSTSKIMISNDTKVMSAIAAAAPYVADESELSNLNDAEAYQIVIDTWKPGSGYTDDGTSTPSYDADEPFLDPNL